MSQTQLPTQLERSRGFSLASKIRCTLGIQLSPVALTAETPLLDTGNHTRLATNELSALVSNEHNETRWREMIVIKINFVPSLLARSLCRYRFPVGQAISVTLDASVQRCSVPRVAFALLVAFCCPHCPGAIFLSQDFRDYDLTR